MRSNSEIVPEVRILSLPYEAKQAINRLQKELGALGESATDEQVQALIDEKLENLPNVKANADMVSLFNSSLWSL